MKDLISEEATRFKVATKAAIRQVGDLKSGSHRVRHYELNDSPILLFLSLLYSHCFSFIYTPINIVLTPHGHNEEIGLKTQWQVTE